MPPRARDPFSPPRRVPERPVPLAVRLAPLPRMVATVVAALVAAGLIATAFAGAAAEALPDSLPAPQMAVDAVAAGVFLALGGLWWWLDPVMVRAGLGPWTRFTVVGVGFLLSAALVTALPALYVRAWPKPVAASTDDALTVLAASLVVPVTAWAPAFWCGELVGRLWRERSRAGGVSAGRPDR